MLENKLKKIILSLSFVAFVFTAFAATTDLSLRFLDKAEAAYEQENIEEAYKYVNQALAVAKDEASQANVLYFARTVYAEKLQRLLNSYDEMAFIEVQTNLERYPNIENAKIKKLARQIEAQVTTTEKAQDRARQQQQFDQMIEAQKEANAEQTNAIREQIEASNKNQAEFKESFERGFSNLGKAFSENAEETKRSTKVLTLSIVGIALLILIIVALIVIVVRKGFKAQQVQQAQYVQAFKMLAANQNQTNRIMLGGITDIYGSNPTMRIAGASTWEPATGLPDVEFTEEDQEELKQLAVKCEEIGSKIDSATGRKNNSKNVSELVYKLSMALGLPQGMAMLNFCAAMIYDAGFLGIDPELLAATNLTDEQKEAIKEHVKLSEKHLEFVPKKFWEVFEDAAMKHHENMDGTGYPNGLKGDQIPLIARLIHVAESFVSLSSKRNYRETMDKETAIAKLREQPQFYDPTVVDVLEQIV
ncbi:HD-GYP domain-containing protein [Treponema sp. C6A8]|uniref:HD-GYP domain-containing protein n=1 Tax=Treponema sp. C6A8 TaxID=1410609 RepID=UPI0004896C5C|nr:HD domain-containing phosphohydrolase [Treponema sp. C6A8]